MYSRERISPSKRADRAPKLAQPVQKTTNNKPEAAAQLNSEFAKPDFPLTSTHILQLQKAIGNRAVEQLMKSRTLTEQVDHGSNGMQPIQRMLDPVGESSNIGEAIRIISEELERQAALTPLPNHQQAREVIAKIKEKDDIGLTVARLNKIVASLNANITGGIIPDKGDGSVEEESGGEYLPVSREEIRSHRYFDRTSLLGLLQDPQIEFWTERAAPIPQNLAIGIIGEYLAKEKMGDSKQLPPEAKILLGLKVCVFDPERESDDKWRAIAEIDDLAVVSGEQGYIPLELVETKAGKQGAKIGDLKTQLSEKIKALRMVATSPYSIISRGKDITDQFDLTALADRKIALKNCGVYEENDYQIDKNDVAGIFDFLQMHQRWMLNGGEMGAMERKRGKL